MITLCVACWALVAQADPWTGSPVPRAGEQPTPDSYGRIDGLEGGPATARWRRSRGPYRAWLFADGQVEHFEKLSGERVPEERYYAASGELAVAIERPEEGPTRLIVALEQPTTLIASGWEPHRLGPVELELPPGATGDARRLMVEGEDWALLASLESIVAQPLAADFVDGLRATCGCELLDATAVWLDGQPGVRFLTRPLIVDPPQLAELTILPLEEHTLMLAYRVARDAPASERARGRAILALARLPAPPETTP